MNHRPPRRLQAATLAGALASTLLMGCQPAPESAPAAQAPAVTMGTQIDDTLITTSVKSALLADTDVKGLDVQVETRNGTVQLSGFVDSQAQIDKALAIARSVTGVLAVNNGVTLRGTPSSTGAMVDDTAVTARVKMALLAEPAIKSLDISVLTVSGTVQLTGFVDSQAQIDQAEAIARATDGASGVKNELVIKR
jgi:hyperosmotically inducible periplasmic protein